VIAFAVLGTVAAEAPQSSGFPFVDLLGLGLVLIVIGALVCRMVRRPKRGGSHAKRE
jgi:hypothetical protein